MNYYETTFYLQPQGEFYLLDLSTDLDHFYKPLLNLILNRNLVSILSITFTDKETSIIISKDLYQRYLENYQFIYSSHDEVYKSEIYNGLQITTKNPGLNETGIINKLTSKFAKYSIPILTMSTYLGNYVFYPADMIDQFQTMLKESQDLKMKNVF